MGVSSCQRYADETAGARTPCFASESTRQPASSQRRHETYHNGLLGRTSVLIRVWTTRVPSPPSSQKSHTS